MAREITDSVSKENQEGIMQDIMSGIERIAKRGSAGALFRYFEFRMPNPNKKCCPCSDCDCIDDRDSENCDCDCYCRWPAGSSTTKTIYWCDLNKTNRKHIISILTNVGYEVEGLHSKKLRVYW